MRGSSEIVEVALEEVFEAKGRPMVVAVVDNVGDLVYFARMDGAGPIRATIRRKMDTKELRTMFETSS